MEYPGHLVEGVLLRKHDKHLADVAVSRDDKLLVRMQTDSHLPACEVLGTRLWFTVNDLYDTNHQVCQLVEVDGGHLVFVNSTLTNTLAKEAIEVGLLQEIQGYTDVKLNAPYTEGLGTTDLLLSNGEEICFVECQEVTMGDEIHRGFTPDEFNPFYCQDLRNLIQMKQAGHRAVLLFCVNHTGIDKVFPADHIDPQYGALLRQAKAVGVEILAYRIAVSLTHVALVEPVVVTVPNRMY